MAAPGRSAATREVDAAAAPAAAGQAAAGAEDVAAGGGGADSADAVNAEPPRRQGRQIGGDAGDNVAGAEALRV